MIHKLFKIGETAVGGIVDVTINDNIIQVKAIDWYTKKTISIYEIDTNKMDAHYDLQDVLHEVTTSYWADKITEWILTKVELKNQFNY